MPSFEEHCRSSELRTGKRYGDLHKWIDKYQPSMGISHRQKRHSLNDVEEIRKRWKDEGVQEFLIHIISDYRDTSYKLIKKAKLQNKEINKIKTELDDSLEQIKKNQEELGCFARNIQNIHKNQYYINSDYIDNMMKNISKNIKTIIEGTNKGREFTKKIIEEQQKMIDELKNQKE